MEKTIIIKREESDDAVIKAEIITNLEVASLVPEKTIEVSCGGPTNSYSDFYDVILKKTFGYVTTLEKANETLRLFQERTGSRFVCYKVQRGFGRDGKYVYTHIGFPLCYM